MKLHLGLSALALVLAACSPAPTNEAEAPADAGGVAAKRLPLPDCAEVEAADQGADGWKHPDCRLMLPDGSGLAIEARYTAAEDESTQVTVQVVQTGDATIQEIVELMGNTFNGPSSEDFDKDGKADIMLPLETGNVNTTWALWRQVDGPKFVRVGEPSGVSVVKTDSGLIAVQGRSSASEYYVDFFKLEADVLKPVVSARVAGQVDDAGTVVSVDCAIEEDEAFAASGLTLDAAKAQFCAEPTVQGLITDMKPTP